LYSPKWGAKEASRLLSGGNRMISGTRLLQDIVVRIYPDDKETPLGTGFFLENDLVITCYHVLEKKDGSLRNCYYIKTDLQGMVAAEPIRSFKPPIDIAILRCQEPSAKPKNVVIRAWDNLREDKFLTRGYDINTPFNEGASAEEGKIVAYTTLDGERRLQLRTELETLLEGRSGSPVWSERLNALVGMIDYRSGKESKSRERSFAIPLEILSQLGIEIYPEGQLYYVPPLPINHLPRSADMQKARDAILSSSGANTAITGTSRSIGLQGMGGIGKSVLTSALARDGQVRRVFKDGIIWIGLGQQADLLQSTLKLIRALEPDHRPIANIAEGRNELERILCDKSCLIILDDVWRMEQLKPFDDLGPDCRILLTTRDQAIVRNAGAAEYSLGLLTDEEALKFLKMMSGKEELPPQAFKVARECDNLPLALAMVAAMVKGRPDDRWENVLHKLRSADLEKIKADFKDYPYPSLMKAIEISIDSLEADKRKRYLELAVFPEDEQVPEGALQVLWNLDRYETQDLIDLFVDRSLATLRDGRLSVHDLLHDFMFKRAGNLLQLHEKLLGAYKSKCGNVWSNGPNDGYFFQRLAYHLSKAGKESDLRVLLFDFSWMQARIQKTDVSGLIQDYDFLSSEKEIFTLQYAIKLSAHVLFRDKKQLPCQLTGRLRKQDSPMIQSMLDQLPRKVQTPWLCPLTQSLTPPGGPLIRTFLGHDKSIMAVAVTHDGNYALSGSDDKTLKLWDLNSGQEIRTFKGHTDSIRAVALTADGHYAISGSSDKTIKLWDLKSGQEIRTFEGHTDSIRAVALTADGHYAISGSSDKTLKLWDLNSGQEIRTFKGHTDSINAVALTADGHYAISGSSDKTLKLWDLNSGQEIRTFKGRTDSVYAVELTADGHHAIFRPRDGKLKRRDLNNGPDYRMLEDWGHSFKITTFAVTVDGRYALCGSEEGIFQLWDLKSDQEIRIFGNYMSWIHAVTLTPDNRYALSSHYDILILWDLEKGQEIRRFDGHNEQINAVALTADGHYVISGSSDKTLKLWDLTSDCKISGLEGHANFITAVALTPDGHYAISGSDDGTIKLWDHENAQNIQTFEGHHLFPVNGLALTPDGRCIVSASYSNLLKIWNPESTQSIRTLEGHDFGVNAVALTPDGKYAVSGSNDCVLKLWDLETGHEIRTFYSSNPHPIEMIAVTPDGSRAISVSSDHRIKLWDLESGKELRKIEPDIREFVIPISVVSMPDNRHALSCCHNNMIKLWDLETGEEIDRFEDIDGWFDGDWLLKYSSYDIRVDFKPISITSDGKHAISGSMDGKLRLWGPKSRSIYAEFIAESPITATAISLDGTKIVAGDRLGRVHLLVLRVPNTTGRSPENTGEGSGRQTDWKESTRSRKEEQEL
jgi:WD40 repeat protein